MMKNYLATRQLHYQFVSNAEVDAMLSVQEATLQFVNVKQQTCCWMMPRVS